MNSETKPTQFDESWTRIKQITGWSGFKELAAFVRSSSQSISGIKARGKFPLLWAREIAQQFSSFTDYIMDGVGPIRRDDSLYPLAEGIKNADTAGEQPLPPGVVRPKFWENEGDLKDDYYLIPRYDVQADCGSGAVVESERVIDRLAFVKSWVNAHHQPSDLFLITAHGHSMTPTINEGDILLVDKSRRRPSADGIYVLSVDHELIAKRLQRLFDGSVKIVSDNKAYDEQLVPADQIEKLEIIGQVVWKGGRV